MASRGVERVLAKCEACINAGNYYEAHQMFRTVSFRYNSQQKYAEAADLLYKGALKLLQHNQHSSGADLSLLLLDSLSKTKSPVTENTISQITKLFEVMDPDCPERYTFLTKAINWSSKVNKEHKRGHPDLHKRFGFIFWHERNYPQARYHYIHSTDGVACAQMLLEFHTAHGYPSEVDMFITQAVLQYLCLQNKATANECFEQYTQKHPGICQRPPFSLPLLNFIWLLLIALDGGKLAVFTVLCEKYQVSINRDPNYKEYLDQIGQLFFGVPPPQKTPQGLFGSLMQNVLGVSGSDDEEEGSTKTKAAAPSLQANNINSKDNSHNSLPGSSRNIGLASTPSPRQEKPLDLD
ncbi:Golgi to ER traffic protein 4 [Biomphalaria glabrata]|uniref:Golgi to ER traffic protein 4 homolog n=1 Tax=Biomphalaria glabrata TaxID=6526 RepID=A0A2C9L8F2_BIOGL|nr:Golgi to ER traffic protein 4 homolog [Biomphalaria glabrata]KAI8765530.1 putative Golgi to ER traffic protein 4 [Biomphalaria glabrata]